VNKYMIITIDCEGTNYDSDIKGSIECMPKFLDICLKHELKVILFVTGMFADEFFKQGMYEKYKNKVEFGLHIHPENLPEKIVKTLDFDTSKEFLADYTKSQKCEMIKKSYDYLKSLGIENIGYFRGGQFSCDNDILNYVESYCTDISQESHNLYREEYKVNKDYLGRILPLFVSSYEDCKYMCLENIPYDELVTSCNYFGFEKTVMLTHSYMFKPDAFRYKRDNISEHITVKFKRLLEHYNII